MNSASDWGSVGREEGFETLLVSNCPRCISRSRDFEKTERQFWKSNYFLLIFLYFSKKRRNTALSCGISAVYLFCLHILVGVAGFEPAASWSRTKRDTKLRHTPKECYRYIIVTSSQIVKTVSNLCSAPYHGIPFVTKKLSS